MRNGTVSHKKISICLISVLVLTLMLTACGAGNKSAGAASGAEEIDISGTYEIVETTGTDGLTPETVEIMKLNDMNITLVLQKDGTGSLDLLGDTTNFTYDAAKKQMTMGGQAYDFIIEGDKLTLKQDSGDMIFQKAEE